MEMCIRDRIDCVVIDEQPALAFVKENKGLKILDEEFTNEDYAFCLQKGNTELRDKVNTCLLYTSRCV